MQLLLFAELPAARRAPLAPLPRRALAKVDAVPAWRPVPLALLAGGADGVVEAGTYADADLAAERARNRRLAETINRRWQSFGVDAGARAVPVVERGVVIGWSVATPGLVNGRAAVAA